MIAFSTNETRVDTRYHHQNSLRLARPLPGLRTTLRLTHDGGSLTDAVHREGGKIALQILHTGRYSYQPNLVAPSAIQAPINRFAPHALSHDEILALIDDFARCAALAREAGVG